MGIIRRIRQGACKRVRFWRSEGILAGDEVERVSAPSGWTVSLASVVRGSLSFIPGVLRIEKDALRPPDVVEYGQWWGVHPTHPGRAMRNLVWERTATGARLYTRGTPGEIMDDGGAWKVAGEFPSDEAGTHCSEEGIREDVDTYMLDVAQTIMELVSRAGERAFHGRITQVTVRFAEQSAQPKETFTVKHDNQEVSLAVSIWSSPLHLVMANPAGSPSDVLYEEVPDPEWVITSGGFTVDGTMNCKGHDIRFCSGAITGSPGDLTFDEGTSCWFDGLSYICHDGTWFPTDQPQGQTKSQPQGN